MDRLGLEVELRALLEDLIVQVNRIVVEIVQAALAPYKESPPATARLVALSAQVLCGTLVEAEISVEYTPWRELRRRGPTDSRPKKASVATKLNPSLTASEKAFVSESNRIHAEYDRPKTRGDCVDGPRPCPWVACRHHLALDINRQTGTIYLIRDWDDGRPTCSLDAVDEHGPMTLDMVGQLLRITRERTRQIEVKGLKTARHRGVEFEDPVEDRPASVIGALVI